MRKKCSMIYWILLPNVEESCIKPDQFHVNGIWLESTYHTFPWAALHNAMDTSASSVGKNQGSEMHFCRPGANKQANKLGKKGHWDFVSMYRFSCPRLPRRLLYYVSDGWQSGVESIVLFLASKMQKTYQNLDQYLIPSKD